MKCKDKGGVTPLSIWAQSVSFLRNSVILTHPIVSNIIALA